MRVLKTISLLVCLAVSGCTETEPEPTPSFDEAERIITEQAAACNDALGMTAVNIAVNDALEKYWDEITATAYPPATTAVSAEFNFANADLSVHATPYSFGLVLGHDITLEWNDAQHLKIENGDTVVVWTRARDWLFEIIHASALVTEWSCSSAGSSAYAQAYNQDERLLAKGFGFYFEAGTGATKASIDFTSYGSDYHIDYCEPAGCGDDRGTETTIDRLTVATLGSGSRIDSERVALNVSLETTRVPSKVGALVRAVRKLEKF